MGGWNKDGWHGYWHIDHPHSVMAHMVGIGGKHQHGKKLGFKVWFPVAFQMRVLQNVPLSIWGKDKE
jgi:hypothetical protein